MAELGFANWAVFPEFKRRQCHRPFLSPSRLTALRLAIEWAEAHELARSAMRDFGDYLRLGK